MGRKRRNKGNNVPPGRVDTPAPNDERNSIERQQLAQRNPAPLETSQAPANRPASDVPIENGQRKQQLRSVTCEEVGINVKQKSPVALPEKLKAGILGRKIKMISNCFPLLIPDGFVYHYDVKVKKGYVSTKLESSSESESTDSEEEVAATNKIKGTHEKATTDSTAAKKKKKYKCMNTKRNRQVINAMIDANDIFEGLYPVYDGKSNLYTRHPLKIGKNFMCEVVLKQQDPFDPNDPRGPKMDHFRIVLKQSIKKNGGCAINLEPLHAVFEGRSKSISEEAIMALETVLRNSPCINHVPIGHSFFYPPASNQLHPLGGGKEIWFGYHQSMRLGQWGPMVNLDVTATPFYVKRPLLNYIAEVLGTDVKGLHGIGGVEQRNIEKMSRELKNLRIEVTHLRYRRRYRIEEKLTVEGANRLTFTKVENGESIQTYVADYFAQRYKPLQFPHLPCVQIKSKSNENRVQLSYLPVEVCEIIRQHCNKELTAKQGAEMIKFTVKPPEARFKEIEGLFKKANYKNDIYLKEFEMEVRPQPIPVEARVLNAPSVMYDQENKVKPYNGVWNMRGQKFFAKALVKLWVLLSLAPVSIPILGDFAKCLRSMANQQGIEMQPHRHIQKVEASLQCVRKALYEMKGRYGADLDLIVIVIPTDKCRNRNQAVSSKDLYNTVKQIAETTSVGLTTQCITADNVIKLSEGHNLSLLSNLCLKINAKMGGVNHLLTPGETPLILQEQPVIIIGADVNHPGPFADNDPKPSLAAVVGSLNSDSSRYAAAIRSQIHEKPKKQVAEIIHDLKDMVVYLLKQFYGYTRKKPEKIIFYRDGVSEGQFKYVQKKEVEKIREACRSLPGEYRPGITYIILQKRHHVKFKPEDERDGVGDTHNPPPGTVIDTTVTHPLNSDFYLYSHYGLKGTSRPGYYTVIADDNNLTADQLYKLTYSLCYTFARCTRSISLPAPVQYAHLAAYRARLHLASKDKECNNGTPQGFYMDIPVIDENLKNRMYFI